MKSSNKKYEEMTLKELQKETNKVCKKVDKLLEEAENSSKK